MPNEYKFLKIMEITTGHLEGSSITKLPAIPGKKK
jgi:hypothetical protein